MKRAQASRTNLALASAVAFALLGLGCGQEASSVESADAGAVTGGDEEGAGWSLLPFGKEEQKVVTISAGQTVRVRTTNTISSKTNQAGETFMVTLEDALTAGGETVAPVGARAVGTVAFVERSGRVKGVARLGVKLTELHLNDGTVLPIETSSYVVAAKKTHVKDAQKVGVGAGIGAAIGALAGGGGGALKGAGAGAGAGTGVVLGTRGDAAVIGSESVLSFTIEQDVQAKL